MSCIYRKPKTLELCHKYTTDENYCRIHKKHANIIYEIYYDIFCDKQNIGAKDLYTILDHIYNNIQFTNITDEGIHDAKKMLFIEMLLKLFSKAQLIQFYEYLYKSPISYDGINKNNLTQKIYGFLYNTYLIDSNHIREINLIQRWYRKYLIKNLTINIDNLHVPVNSEDIFTYDDINDIPKEKLFCFYDDTYLYAFDAVELEYFVRKCEEDKIEPYNPYTKNILSSKILRNLEFYILYNKLKKKSIDSVWITDLQAYTDLAFVIEKNGFYNSPDWYMKFDRRSLMNIIKIFKDFSMSVPESQNYFRNFFSTPDNESIVFKFCRESIRLFKECNEDKYILCCNFMKALAMCSSDFYNNLPNWLANTFTASNVMHTTFLNNNFLFYYYVEYLE